MDEESILIEQHPSLRKQSAAENTFWLALGYSEAMVFLCNGIIEDEFRRQFHNTRVILQLAHHATELVLKAAILSKNVQPPKTHSLERLYGQYRELFPSKAFEIEIPFEILDSRSGELFPELSVRESPLSERFRYATRSDGAVIYEYTSFHANEWLDKLQDLHNMFSSLYFKVRASMPKKGRSRS